MSKASRQTLKPKLNEEIGKVFRKKLQEQKLKEEMEKMFRKRLKKKRSNP